MGEQPNEATNAVVKAHTRATLPAPNKGKKHLRGDCIADILRYDEQGLNQEDIAAKFDPPLSQSTVSRTLRRYGPDRTPQAKRIISALAPDMVLDVFRNGRAADKVALMKGSVLNNEAGNVFNLAIGLSLPGMPVQSESLTIASAIDAGSDK